MAKPTTTRPRVTPRRGRPGVWQRFLLPLVVIGAFVSAVEIGRRLVQRRQLYRPNDGADRGVTPTADLLRRDVFFRAAGNGPRLHGIWWPHPRPRASVLYCHGQRGTLASMEEDLAGIRQRLEVDLFAFDYRGYGASEGTPSERGLYADARGAWQMLCDELGVDPTRLILFGHSLGSAVAIETARSQPAAGLVIQSAFTDVRDMAKVKFPGWPVHWVTRNEFRSIDKVPSLRGPKLFIHGREDHTVPLEIARRLYTAAAAPKRFLTIGGADHNQVIRRGGLRWTAEVRRFIDAAVEAAGQT